MDDTYTFLKALALLQSEDGRVASNVTLDERYQQSGSLLLWLSLAQLTATSQAFCPKEGSGSGAASRFKG